MEKLGITVFDVAVIVVAIFGMLMHVPRSDLHFQWLAFGADDRRVQRPVIVGLGFGDVHSQPQRTAKNRTKPQPMGSVQAQCSVCADDAVKNRNPCTLT